MTGLAIFVSVFLIALGLHFYRRKRGHYPSFGRKRIINEPCPSTTGAPRIRYRGRGVWRPTDPEEEELPGYTTEATCGELSLGIGRKLSRYEDELEEPETTALGLTSEERRDSRGLSAGGEVAPGAAAATAHETLPPYIPPPPRAALAEAETRNGLRRSFGPGPRRGSYPTSRRIM